MDSIQMVDLKGQYLRIKDQIDKAIIDVVESTAFINGPAVKDFSHNLSTYLGGAHVIPCANGTDALQIALMALDLKPGDEIITPSYTYVATAEVIALLGLTPVFVDVNPDDFTIDPEHFKNAITSKTKAVMAVHLYGQCANMEAILPIAEKYDISIIEDTAQAIGSSYKFKDGSTKKAGTLGRVGTTSFFPSKNLGCYGDGGAIFTTDEQLAQKIRMTANHGQSKKYHHDIIGVNSRLDSIQAAVLNVKLQYLDEYIVARNLMADAYDAAFSKIKEIEIPQRVSWSNHGFHQYTLKLKDDSKRSALFEHLKTNNIPFNIYYPIPIHQQKGYQNAGRKMDLSVTVDLTKRVFSLPIHTEYNQLHIDKITNTIIDFFK